MNMDGVERKLYHLPEVIKSTQIICTEGEKDADNLISLGYTATTNVGGSKSWLDSYAEALAGKDIVICGDNDDSGQAYVKKVFDSIASKAKTMKIIKIPDLHKDASDWISTFKDSEEAKKRIQDLIDSATPHIKGQRLPLFSMREIEPLYLKMVKEQEKSTLSLSKWLPSLNRLRPLVPGELVLVVGDTGIGKTAVLQTLAFKSLPLPTLFFEMELPSELLFERFIAVKTQFECRDIEASYQKGETMGPKALDHFFANLCICSEAKLTLQSLEDIINRSELKLGCRPKVVFLDYVQLMAGQGKRYERTSDTAEGLKILAKSTSVVMVVASQIQRPTKDNPSVGLHSAKDSGALENSAGLVVGIRRDEKDETLLHLKVLKSTKGGAGITIECNYFAHTMQINERAAQPVTDTKPVP